MRQTCLHCCSVWWLGNEVCPNCGCPYSENMFDDPTGEQQDNALRGWYDQIAQREEDLDVQ